jgi:hypothetical protein
VAELRLPVKDDILETQKIGKNIQNAFAHAAVPTACCGAIETRFQWPQRAPI